MKIPVLPTFSGPTQGLSRLQLTAPQVEGPGFSSIPMKLSGNLYVPQHLLSSGIFSAAKKESAFVSEAELNEVCRAVVEVYPALLEVTQFDWRVREQFFRADISRLNPIFQKTPQNLLLSDLRAMNKKRDGFLENHSFARWLRRAIALARATNKETRVFETALDKVLENSFGTPRKGMRDICSNKQERISLLEAALAEINCLLQHLDARAVLGLTRLLDDGKLLQVYYATIALCDELENEVDSASLRHGLDEKTVSPFELWSDELSSLQILVDLSYYNGLGTDFDRKPLQKYIENILCLSRG
ncbi:MAG: hypothetical protein COX62_02630 [Deltaproteobacteria bacterium CG_4_10_14_0_2_um_filter_43_8]|nr:MAG: hypothetical protein COV43_04140 [Deltaproteobacteria bacterium CG11_big_fil_rev_8_21_14_0_20_42_23]PJA21369.1 MAG: hypothetical protein COX62_02630 [Deltaproteobacteria bacterium CG_4_10_14_0_2_um_filter_43_8]PJC64116.1 MAG: hypothetical protein CO021_05845 [Deltaproteobacteria bacterium CG_4_9_14_0_2_um_filter_42_21]